MYTLNRIMENVCMSRVVMSVTISCVKTMFGSSLRLVVCRKSHVFIYAIYIYLRTRGVQHDFILRVTWPVSYTKLLTIHEYMGSSLICFGGVRVSNPFSSVCFVCLIVCLVVLLSSLCALCLMLPVSLDCPFLISPSDFSNVFLYFAFLVQKWHI
jgi:hypothetical protein